MEFFFLNWCEKINIDQCLCVLDVTSRGKDGEQDNLTHYHSPKIMRCVSNRKLLY